MPACCGEERATAFCPDCGKRLAGPKDEIVRHMANRMAHLKKHIDGRQGWLEKFPNDGDASEGVRERTKRRQARDRVSLARWQSWLDWVLKQGD